MVLIGLIAVNHFLCWFNGHRHQKWQISLLLYWPLDHCLQWFNGHFHYCSHCNRGLTVIICRNCLLPEGSTMIIFLFCLMAIRFKNNYFRIGLIATKLTKTHFFVLIAIGFRNDHVLCCLMAKGIKHDQFSCLVK
jgi:hypothetical protein